MWGCSFSKWHGAVEISIYYHLLLITIPIPIPSIPSLPTRNDTSRYIKTTQTKRYPKSRFLISSNNFYFLFFKEIIYHTYNNNKLKNAVTLIKRGIGPMANWTNVFIPKVSKTQMKHFLGSKQCMQNVSF